MINYLVLGLQQLREGWTKERGWSLLPCVLSLETNSHYSEFGKPLLGSEMKKVEKAEKVMRRGGKKSREEAGLAFDYSFPYTAEPPELPVPKLLQHC